MRVSTAFLPALFVVARVRSRGYVSPQLGTADSGAAVDARVTRLMLEMSFMHAPGAAAGGGAGADDGGAAAAAKGTSLPLMLLLLAPPPLLLLLLLLLRASPRLRRACR